MLRTVNQGYFQANQLLPFNNKIELFEKVEGQVQGFLGYQIFGF